MTPAPKRRKIHLEMSAPAHDSPMPGSLKQLSALPVGSAPALSDLVQNGQAELFRRFVDSVRDYAIFLLNPDGRIASWNAGAERIKGYAAGDVIGKHFSIFYPSEAVERGWPQEELRRAAVEGRLEDEGWRLRKDGSRFWANVIISPLLGPNAEVLGFSKVTRDLSERRRHEQELREREENLRLLVEGVQDHAMFLLDPNGRIRAWNVGAQKVFGYEAAQVLGQSVSMLLADDAAHEAVQHELASAARDGFVKVHGWRRRADGATFWAEATTTAVMEEGGEPRAFVRIVHDLTGRQRMEALELEGRRMAEFIAMLSHELRSPLAPLRNAVTILRQFADRPEALRCVELVGRQVSHMTRLVDDLLDVSRITTGKISLEPVSLEFNTLVRMAVETSKEFVRSHGHRLTVSLAARPITVRGDTTRLTQVVVNLLTNAAKYTKPEGHIQVIVRDGQGICTLQVTDTGIGMTESLLQRAFEPFVQGVRTLDRAEGGLGIGLALVKNIVELHGGSVRASSPGTGKGTTMTVTLPTVSDVEAAVDERIETVVPGGKRVLVVDDNEDAGESLALLLEMSGHTVKVAHNGAQALAAAAAFRPDSILLDIGLPGMDGYELARRLRELPDLRNVQLIAITGYGQSADRHAAAAAGFHVHLTKPVDPEALARLIA